MVGQIDAFQVYWSPEGDQLAYTRFISESLDMNELYLADPDGADPQLYATMTQGEFISWSPQGDRFLYQDNFQVLPDEPDRPAQRLTNSVSMVGPRWVSDTKVMAFHDTGDGWLLTLRDVTGDCSGLAAAAAGSNVGCRKLNVIELWPVALPRRWQCHRHFCFEDIGPDA